MTRLIHSSKSNHTIPLSSWPLIVVYRSEFTTFRDAPLTGRRSFTRVGTGLNRHERLDSLDQTSRPAAKNNRHERPVGNHGSFKRGTSSPAARTFTPVRCPLSDHTPAATRRHSIFFCTSWFWSPWRSSRRIGQVRQVLVFVTCCSSCSCRNSCSRRNLFVWLVGRR